MNRLYRSLMSLVKFIDQWAQGRYFMPKIETNSVDYNSLIGTDFKNATPTDKGVRQHVPAYLLVAAALLGILVVSVVLAKSNNDSNKESNTQISHQSNQKKIHQILQKLLLLNQNLHKNLPQIAVKPLL